MTSLKTAAKETSCHASAFLNYGPRRSFNLIIGFSEMLC